MNDIQDTVDVRRVPFTYYSLLYKLDNIHLKQTYRGKRFVSKPLKRAELKSLQKEKTGLQLNTHKEVENGFHSIKENKDQLNEKRLRKIPSPGLKADNSHTVLSWDDKSNSIQCDSDSEVASDLSVDGEQWPERQQKEIHTEVTFEEDSSSISNIDVEEDSSSFKELLPSHAEKNEIQISEPLGYLSGKRFYPDSEVAFQTDYDVSNTYQHTTSDEISAKEHRLNQTTTCESLYVREQSQHSTNQYTNTTKQCSTEQTSGELVNIPHNEVIVDVSGGKLDNSKQSNTTKVELSSFQESIGNATISSEEFKQTFGNGNTKKVQKSEESGLRKMPTLDLIDNNSIEQIADLNTINRETTDAEYDEINRCNTDQLEGLVKTNSDLSLPCTIEIKKCEKAQKARELTSEKIIITKHISVNLSATSLQTSHAKSDFVLTKTNKITCDDEGLSRTLPTNSSFFKPKINLSTKVFDKMYGSCNRQNGLFVKEYDNNTRLFSDLFNDRSSPRRLSISSEKAPSENENRTFLLSDQSKTIMDNDLRMCFSKPETSLEDDNIPKSKDQSGHSNNEVSKIENNSLKLSTVFSKSYDGSSQLTNKRDTFSASFPPQKISAKPLQTDLSISFDQRHISSVAKKETPDFHTEQLKKEVAKTNIKDQTTNLIQGSMEKKSEDFLEHSTNTSQNHEVSSQVTGCNITEESSTESCDRPECINDRTTWDEPTPGELNTKNASFVKTDTCFVEENGKVGDNSNVLPDNEKCANKIGENITWDSNVENSGQDVASEQFRSIYPQPESSESKAVSDSYDPSLEIAELDRRIDHTNEMEKSCRTSKQTVDNKTTEEQTHSDSTDCKEITQNTINRLDRPENAIHGFLSMQARDIQTEFDCPVNSSKSETISGNNCPSREIIKIDGHYSDTNEKRVLDGNQYEQAVDVGATKERTHPSSADGTDIIQITIKRLDRPKKSESKSKESSAKHKLGPFTAQQNCPFPDESSAFGKMSGGRYSKSSESFTSKMFVENMANLPIVTGQDIPMTCPTCGEAVFYTGKTETKCIDEIHQMLLKIPSLQTTAEKYGLVVRNIAGDGNCMFSAVIDQLRIAGDFTFTKDSLRSSAVEYLREHPCQEDGSHLMCFLSTESWEEYLSRMNRDGEWGDHMILNAITEVVGRNITVLGSSGNVTQLFPHNITVTDDLFLDSVYLGHIGGTHYVSLRPKDWEKTWPMNAKIRRMTKFLELREEISNCWNDQSDASDIALEKESSIKTTEDSSHVDKTSVLDSLSTDIHYVDPISRVPVMHLSYILKELLHLEYFCRRQTTKFNPTGETKLELEEIGTNAEHLNVSLINFSKARKERYHADYAYIKQMLTAPPSWYTVVMNELSVGHDGKGQVMLLVDSEQTHAGFLRLRPIGCSCCSDFRTIARKMDGRWFVNDLQISLWVMKGDEENLKYIKAVKCPTWPYQAVEYLTRSRPVQWPKQETIDLICKSGCFLAHKSHPDSNEKDIEFQFMFCSAEKQLIRDEMTPDMKYCYYVFKALVEFQTKDVNCKLTNYILKTTWFYACEAIPSETWRNSCGSCLLYMLDLLVSWLRNSNIPNYFINHYNMIDHWRKKDVDEVCDKIETLRLFPCMVLHFISEEYGLTRSWLIDSVMASSKKYKADGDVNWVVENTFNPTTFYLTGYSLKTWRNNEIVFGQLSEAYEKNLIWTGQSLNFREFIDAFLLTVNGTKTRKAFLEFVEEELNIKDNAIVSQTVGEFLGPQYKGKYVNKVIKPDSRSAIDRLMLSLISKQEFKDMAEIVVCLIHKYKIEMESSPVDVSSIDDTDLRKEIVQSNHANAQKTLKELVKNYFLLCFCYSHMNQLDLIREVINDYEDAALKVPSRLYLSDLVELWEKLERPEKAKEIEEIKMNLLLEDKDEDLIASKLLTLILLK